MLFDIQDYSKIVNSKCKRRGCINKYAKTKNYEFKSVKYDITFTFKKCPYKLRELSYDPIGVYCSLYIAHKKLGINLFIDIEIVNSFSLFCQNYGVGDILLNLNESDIHGFLLCILLDVRLKSIKKWVIEIILFNLSQLLECNNFEETFDFTPMVFDKNAFGYHLTETRKQYFPYVCQINSTYKNLLDNYRKFESFLKRHFELAVVSKYLSTFKIGIAYHNFNFNEYIEKLLMSNKNDIMFKIVNGDILAKDGSCTGCWLENIVLDFKCTGHRKKNFDIY